MRVDRERAERRDSGTDVEDAEGDPDLDARNGDARSVAIANPAHLGVLPVGELDELLPPPVRHELPLFASRGLYLTAALYTAYWIIALVSWRRWLRLAGEAAAPRIAPQS